MLAMTDDLSVKIKNHPGVIAGVLSAEHHGRLIADIDNFASDANIQASWVWTPLANVCSVAEIEWVKKFKTHADDKKAGMVYLGQNADVLDRMSAISGALTRNFIRSRVVTFNEFIDSAGSAVADYSCLLVPNFFTGIKEQDWRLGAAYDLLLHRHVKGLQTVIYVTDMSRMRAMYGQQITFFVEYNFRVVQVA